MHKPENMKKIWTKWQEKGTALWNLLTPNKTTAADDLKKIEEQMNKIYKRKPFKVEKISLDMVREKYSKKFYVKKFNTAKSQKAVDSFNNLCDKYIELEKKISEEEEKTAKKLKARKKKTNKNYPPEKQQQKKKNVCSVALSKLITEGRGLAP